MQSTPCHKTDKSHAAEVDLTTVNLILEVAHRLLCAENVRSGLSPPFKATEMSQFGKNCVFGEGQ